MNKELTIGRNPDNDILMLDLSVSRKHAILFISFDSFVIQDKDSANGTYINGMRINGSAPLRRNDILKVGNSLVPWMNYVDVADAEVKTAVDGGGDTHTDPPTKVIMDLPNASGAQTCGILGLIFSLGLIGIILNIIALSLAGGAIANYKHNPDKYTAKSYRKAKAGQTMGIIGLSIFVVVLIIIIAANS